MSSITESCAAYEKIDRIGDLSELDIDEMMDGTIHVMQWIEAGLAVRAHGLIYFLPLCHDSYNEGNA
jgi:hypothetical protein